MKYLILLLIPFLSYAQYECGTVATPNTLFISQQMARVIEADNTIRTIPAVFHCVWNPTLNPNDSLLFASKVSIYLDILNKDFRKRNADTALTVAQFRPVAADAQIEFCMDRVIYVRTTEVSFTTNDKIKYTPTGSPAVDPVKYLNIWMGRLSGNLGGYAYLPSPSVVGQPFDGVVGLLSTTGNDEQLGEILVHEIEHYLNVYHTFQGGCTGEGDFCADTPPTGQPNGCNLSLTDCGGLVMTQNYMDYAHCGTIMTKDQVTRMTATLVSLREPLWNSGVCSGTPGNTPPVVTITSPVNGQRFNASASITINVTATDNGTISKVDFYNGTTILSTDVTAPYSFTWTNVQSGNYTLIARATDNDNAVGTSTGVSIVVGNNQAPTCVITSPANNSVIELPKLVQFYVNATDDVKVKKVEFMFANGTVIASDTTAPYQINFGTSVGTHQLQAKAYDATTFTLSQVVTITVTNPNNPPPVVSLSATVSGNTVTMTATATDNTGVSKVDFYQGSTLLNTDVTSPYSFVWNAPDGSYVLTARAFDTQGSSAVSSPVNITVVGGSPIIRTTLLSNGTLRFEAQDGRVVTR